MCGIFGFVAKTDRDSASVLAGLRYLEYRGYDSWGVAIEREGAVAHQKAVGSIAEAHPDLPASAVALGHTRWATHGSVTVANAHPHLDCSGRFALIHNGIVENYRELGSRLRRSHQFASQTDTEVLVHLLEELVDEEPDLLRALLAVFRQVQGLSAVAVLDAGTRQVAVAKNGSPLVLGWSKDASYVASDPIALVDHTRDITFLEDGQGALLHWGSIELVDIATGTALQPEMRHVSWDVQRAGLNGYAHFMEKEIHEQPGVLRDLVTHGPAQAARLAELIQGSRELFLIGCGTAHNAALSARYMLSEMAGVVATAAVASEMSPLYPALGPDSLVIAFSQSGETIDVLEAVREARTRGATVAAVVNAEGSALDRFADLTLLLRCGPERCVLATKSYTAKLGIMQLTARSLAGELDRGIREICDAATAVQSLLDCERSGGRVRSIAQSIADHQHLFVLGRDRNYPPALEAALKIKEVSYMHAEGFASGELKHGVIALVTNGTPCIVLAPDHEHRGEVLAAAAEVHARGAHTIGISPRDESEFSVTIPVRGQMSGPYEIAAVTQLLAYELARLRGCDPDKPRNLAKSVTVK